MTRLSILLSLASAVTAIDVLIHTNSDSCEGRWIGCLALNPNVCCSLAEGSGPVSYNNVPNWYIETRNYREQNCDSRWQSTGNWRGGQFNEHYCAYGTYRSAGYGILNRKRGENNVVQKECQKPNAMGFEDGTQYNLTAMDATLISELMGYNEAKGAADLPTLFQEYQM